MDDLLGEDWQKPAKTTTPTPFTANSFASRQSGLRASPQPPLPLSGSSTPSNISRPTSTVNGGPKASSSDAFGSLTSIKSQKAGGAVSMQERQKQLVEEKRRQQEQQNSMWDTLGSGRGTPEIRQPSPAVPQQQEEDDILAAFHKDAPVNNASHFMPPTSSQATSGRSTPAAAAKPTPPVSAGGGAFDGDDDPFGLGEISKKSNGHAKPPAGTSNDDDILGDLGRPVTQRPPRPASPQSPDEPMLQQNSMTNLPPELEDERVDPRDRPLAELVDMGFPADTAKIALAENGGNVQSAVGWLLQQAHEESRQKARGETPVSGRQSRQTGSRSPPRRQRTGQDSVPSWVREEGRPSSASRRQDNASPANGEKDPTQIASEFGTKLFKSANSIWKASQKQMAKTMAEFQQESDPSRPKWMRDASADGAAAPAPRRETREQAAERTRQENLTNEAALLDAPRERPTKPQRPSAPERPTEPPSRGRSPVEALPHRPSSQPRFMQQAPPQPDKKPASKLSRQDVEDQSAQAYVSPARRKRPTPKPEPTPEPEVDLFSPAPPKASPAPAQAPPSSRPTPPISRPSPAPVPVRPKAPPRNIPSISPSALSTSASHRKAGGDHYKRGDYGAAHESYTAALTPVPSTHPLAIIVLSNRSLTALKTGDPKAAVSDADRALDIIGPSFGVGETIDLGAGEGVKEMREFYGKALMRKAEALEHLEKYSDAAAVWRTAIEAGVGGAVSLRGRDRCEKAAAPKAAAAKPKPASTPRPTKAPPTRSLGNSMSRPTLPSAQSTTAVRALRAANAAAEKADDEKFALSDSVDAKLKAWRGGKEDNLRALLQSMDLVLWEAAGWKKVGMSDLVMPGKVKVVYMRAIGRVHPDKIPQDATTEQKMISAAVFATLNEAWDKFKTENEL